MKETFLFINKSPESHSLSQSRDAEREDLYKHVQRKVWAKISAEKEHGNSPLKTTPRLRRCKRSKKHDGNERVAVVLAQPGNASNDLTSQVPPQVRSGSVYSLSLLEAFLAPNVSALQHQDDHLHIQSFFWISRLPSIITTNDDVLHPCVVALAGAGLGRAKNDQRLVHAASSAYSQALTAFSTSRLSILDNQTFAACLSLLMYQFFAQQPGRGDWTVHANGLSTMVQARGPESFQDGFAHELFVCCRAILISSAMHARKATFLAAQEWQDMPWALKGKTSYERVLDCLSLLPRLGEKFEAIHGEERYEFLSELWTTVGEFCQCFAVVSNVATPVGTVPTTLQGLPFSSLPEGVFPQSYEFRSLAKSNMFRLFLAGLIDLYNMLALTYEALSKNGVYAVENNPLLQCCSHCSIWHHEDQVSEMGIHDSHYFCSSGAFAPSRQYFWPQDNIDTLSLAFACRSFARDAAEQVCMSLQHCLKPEHGTVGRFLSVLPLKMVIWCFVVNIPAAGYQLEWVYAVVRMLARSGVPFSANLLNDRPYYTGRSMGQLDEEA